MSGGWLDVVSGVVLSFRPFFGVFEMNGNALRPVIDRSILVLSVVPSSSGYTLFFCRFCRGLFYAELGWIEGHALCMTLKLLHILGGGGFCGTARGEIPGRRRRAMEKAEVELGWGGGQGESGSVDSRGLFCLLRVCDDLPVMFGLSNCLAPAGLVRVFSDSSSGLPENRRGVCVHMCLCVCLVLASSFIVSRLG